MTLRNVILLIALVAALGVSGQERKRLPDVSTTFQGILAMPIPLNNPLFSDITETIGRLGAAVQFPLQAKKDRAFGLGGGYDLTWSGIRERALAPEVITGEVRRSAWYGKMNYSGYGGPRSFYELYARLGTVTYTYDCSTCGEGQSTAFHWGLGAGYFFHASDNLAFGLTMAYERDALRFSAADLGLESFPGRRETVEASDYQNLFLALVFSTRLRKAPDTGRSW